MEEVVRETRHLPAFVRNGLERIEASPFVGDGRSVDWVRKLGETEFASIEIRDEVNSKGKRARVTVKAEITARGRYVLERDRRGVDPYIRTT